MPLSVARKAPNFCNASARALGIAEPVATRPATATAPTGELADQSPNVWNTKPSMPQRQLQLQLEQLPLRSPPPCRGWFATGRGRRQKLRGAWQFLPTAPRSAGSAKSANTAGSVKPSARAAKSAGPSPLKISRMTALLGISRHVAARFGCRARPPERPRLRDRTAAAFRTPRWGVCLRRRFPSGRSRLSSRAGRLYARLRRSTACMP